MYRLKLSQSSSAPISIIPKHSCMTSAKRPATGFGLITRNTSKSNIVAPAHCGTAPCHSSSLTKRWCLWHAQKINDTVSIQQEKKNKKNMGGSTYHTHSCTSDMRGEGGVWVLGFFLLLYTLHCHILDQRVIDSRDMSDTLFQKSRIKVDDIIQHSLQRNKINVQSGDFIKGSPVLTSWLKLVELPLPPSQWK